jgi:ubiquinone/menaquinone biosynthesis C-methylase UbiE
MEESKHIKLNEAKWNKWAETADGTGWLNDYLRRAQLRVISLLDLKDNMNFLDIGCGTGWAVGQAAESAGYRGSFYGVDLSSGMIAKAKKKFKDHNNFYFIQANSESVPLDDNLFENIICTNSFHHYLHPEKVMEEIFRLLQPGGRIYILDPTADMWFIKIVDRIIRLFEPQHVKIYSTDEFKRLMIDAGLSYMGYKEIKPKQKVQIGEK